MEEKNQEELAKEWEEALKAQEKEQQEKTEPQGASEGEEKEESSSQEDVMAAWQEALAQQEKSSSEPSEPEEKKCDGKLDLIKDIPLEVSVEVGSTKLPLEEILNLHSNSVVELDRFVDEPIDIKINGKLVAKGKLYVVKDSYGVEIVQIITPEERLKLLEE